MQHQKGMAVCWCIQPMARVRPNLIPGRVIGIEPGYVRIRVFEAETECWIERPVRPVTLRRIGPQQSALLEKQEATWPVPGLGNGSKGESKQAVDLTQPTKPATVILSDAAPEVPSRGRVQTTAVAGPDNARQRERRQTSETPRRRSLGEISDLRESVGRVGDPDTDLNIRLAYRVLVMGESLGRAGSQAGVSRQRVQQRVRLGVVAALKRTTDPNLKSLRDHGLPMLRRHASALKPVLEMAFLSEPEAHARRAASPRLALRR